MGKGKTHIHNYLPSPDTRAMRDAIHQFGAEVTFGKKEVILTGVGGNFSQQERTIDAGNSGLVLRLIGALAALSPSSTLITGDRSICTNRPIHPLVDALRQLGATADYLEQEGYAPLRIRGSLQPGTARLSGEDSQPVSGLLIAASFLPGKTEIIVDNPGEKPWIDLTLNWLARFNLRVEQQRHTRYVVQGYGEVEGFDYTIPGDLSSAAFPLAAAIVTNSEITLHGIDMTDCQGDKKLIEVLIAMGAQIDIDPARHTLTVKRGSHLRGMKLDINDYIDGITILAVLACYAEGTTEIVNAAIARRKECDRIRAICTELQNMGAQIEETSDGLIISHSPLRGARLNSHADHRMAMSLAVAALGASGESTIDNVDCVSKTFPTFAQDFSRLGASIREIP
jgi:3-phosphoshikimate 1-carboxyvinyltransferase